jgi:hypothetical protein
MSCSVATVRAEPFEAVTGQRRRPVSMAFTREQLRRICNDFEDAIL